LRFRDWKSLLAISFSAAPVLAPLALAEAPQGVSVGAKLPPSTISPTFARSWSAIIGRQTPPSPILAPDDLTGWAREQAKTEKSLAGVSKVVPKMLGVSVTERKIAGVPVLEVTPAGWRDDGRLLIYTHGGGFTSLSAHSTLFSSGLMANATGLRVLSIDYTLAPHAKWRTVMDQVTSVYRSVLKMGTQPTSIGLYGDSAGGSIAAGMVLKLRDESTPMPGALILWSPWSDVTLTGDTYQTLAAWEPMLTIPSLTASAAAYALPTEQKNPYVSPVYGDYAKGYPATLIQCGTREIFLSNCVRHYRAIRDAGGEAVLDMYEGMPHVFQMIGPGSPESAAAMAEVKRFWNTHLARQR